MFTPYTRTAFYSPHSGGLLALPLSKPKFEESVHTATMFPFNIPQEYYHKRSSIYLSKIIGARNFSVRKESAF
jgi:hypothetical protein